jgi:hypothetical protein
MMSEINIHIPILSSVLSVAEVALDVDVQERLFNQQRGLSDGEMTWVVTQEGYLLHILAHSSTDDGAKLSMSFWPQSPGRHV